MSAPRPDACPDPDYDELWRLAAKLSVIADRAVAGGFRCDIPLSRREVEVLRMVDQNPTAAA